MRDVKLNVNSASVECLRSNDVIKSQSPVTRTVKLHVNQHVSNLTASFQRVFVSFVW